MRWLILGATGSLGPALVRAVEARGHQALTAARTHAMYCFDVRDEPALEHALNTAAPDAVINAAAVVDHGLCEADPGLAYSVNAAPVAALAAWSARTGRPLVQVSTDQFFWGDDGDAAHDEDAPVTVKGGYARSKFAGEAFALTSPHALVARVNMAAAWPGRGKASIAHWAFEQLEARAQLRLFDDYFCSTIDAPSLAEALLDLVAAGAHGRLNVACREVASKKAFVHALAQAAGITLDWDETASARDLDPPRATSVGLDVSRAEAILNRPLPTLAHVAANFAAQRRLGP